jgi:ribosomal protein S20
MPNIKQQKAASSVARRREENLRYRSTADAFKHRAGRRRYGKDRAAEQHHRSFSCSTARHPRGAIHPNRAARKKSRRAARRGLSD